LRPTAMALATTGRSPTISSARHIESRRAHSPSGRSSQLAAAWVAEDQPRFLPLQDLVLSRAIVDFFSDECSVESPWFTGRADVLTYTSEEQSSMVRNGAVIGIAPFQARSLSGTRSNRPSRA